MRTSRMNFIASASPTSQNAEEISKCWKYSHCFEGELTKPIVERPRNLFHLDKRIE